MRVAIVSERQNELGDFAHGLGGGVEWLKMQNVLDVAAKAPWQLVVVDTLSLDSGGYKAFLHSLLKVNAMLNTVVMTAMDAEAFHEDSEGLGVLCAVPVNPGREDGVRVMNQLCSVLGL